MPTPSELESDSEPARAGSTVWSHRPIASYLSLGDTVSTDTETDHDSFPLLRSHPSSSTHTLRSTLLRRTPSDPISDDETGLQLDEELPDGGYNSSDTQGEHEPRTVRIDDITDFPDFDDTFYDDEDLKKTEDFSLDDLDVDEVGEQPSLGLLDEALSFIAAERERWSAQREAVGANADAEGRITIVGRFISFSPSCRVSSYTFLLDYAHSTRTTTKTPEEAYKDSPNTFSYAHLGHRDVHEQYHSDFTDEY